MGFATYFAPISHVYAKLWYFKQTESWQRAPPEWLACCCHLMPDMTICFLRARKEVWDGFEISTLRMCWLYKHRVCDHGTLGIQNPKRKQRPEISRCWRWGDLEHLAKHLFFYHLHLAPLSLPFWSPLPTKMGVSSRLIMVGCQKRGDHGGLANRLHLGGLFREGVPPLFFVLSGVNAPEDSC